MKESPEEVDAFRRRLLAFYDAKARDLPWRRTSDPYAIWVSEIMAQQTRVDTAIPYYQRWLERYPDVGSLARAPLDDVLKSWEGLGYYSRARNLHRAAQVVAETLEGVVPDTAEGLRELPGIGPYAAGAIASIAFDRPVPAVDGNVRRVFARLHDEPEPKDGAVRAWAERALDPDRPGDFNQALMELGATVCTPRRVRCDVCPVAAHCRALDVGTVDERPAPKRRARVRTEVRVVAVFAALGSAGWAVLVRRRPAEGLLAGLWELPSAQVDDSASDAKVAQALLALAEARSVEVGAAGWAELDPVVHKFSHLHVTYRPWLIRAEGRGGSTDDEVRWIEGSEAGGVTLPVTDPP